MNMGLLTVSPEKLLTQLVDVLKTILPPDTEKSFQHKMDEKKFSFCVIFKSEANMLESADFRCHLAELMSGFNVEIRYLDLDDGRVQMEREYEVSDVFLNLLAENLSNWGLSHPILAIKTVWRNSTSMSRPGRK